MRGERHRSAEGDWRGARQKRRDGRTGNDDRRREQKRPTALTGGDLVSAARAAAEHGALKREQGRDEHQREHECWQRSSETGHESPRVEFLQAAAPARTIANAMPKGAAARSQERGGMVGGHG